MNHRLQHRVQKLETTRAGTEVCIYVQREPADESEMAEAKRSALAQGKIFVVLNETDMRL